MARVARRRTRDEEAPRSSRYVEDVDDEEPDDDIEEEEEEAPRRSRRGASRESSRDTSRPAGRRGSSRSRSRDEDDEEEEERPRRSAAGRGGKRESSSSSSRAVEEGWGAVDKLKSQGGFAENLKVPKDDEIIVKFLDEKPFAGYREHWVQEAKTPRKTFTCLGGKECPLCTALGHQASGKVLINVVDMSDDPTAKVWAMGTRLAEKLKTLAEKPRTKPLNRWSDADDDLYWAVSKSGKGTSTEYNLEPIKAADLADWGIEPLEAGELDDLMEQRSTKEIIRWDTLEDLENLVEEIL